MTTTLTARGPEDLLAAVPVVLGFRPAQSLVMLTFGGRHPFHARVDLPAADAPARTLRELADTLLTPALQQSVERVAFVVYTDRRELAARLGRTLGRHFARGGIGVIDVLRAHDGLWTGVPCHPQQRERPPRPFDDRWHPFAAQAVFEGRVTHGSREELRRRLDPDPELRRRTVAALAALPPPGPDELARMLDLVVRCVAGRREPSDPEAARLLRAVSEVELRDAALHATEGVLLEAHLGLWAALLRRAPDAQVPDVAALAAFCAWRSGHGALAWCALDRCFEVDPGHRLGLVLAECLVRAVPPALWEEVGEDRPDGECDTA